jgi:hypothetical protein
MPTRVTRWPAWRIALYAGPAGLLSLPLIGMRLSKEVDWTAGDFLAAATLLYGAAFCCDKMARTHGSRRLRIAGMLAVLVATATLWALLALGD